MEVSMTPVPLEEVPGFRRDRSHDRWAADAVDAFLEAGCESALLDVPEFGVSHATVVGCLRMHANARGVKVRDCSRPRPRVGKDTYLIREEALDAKRG